MRSTSRALSTDIATQPKTNGMSTLPDAVADMPLTACRNSGTNEIAPNIAMPARNPVAAAARTTRLPNSRSGTIGSATRRSTAKNAGSATTAIASRTCTSAPGPGPARPPSRTPTTKAETPADDRHADRHQRAGAEALQHAEDDELRHVLRGA